MDMPILIPIPIETKGKFFLVISSINDGYYQFYI